MKNAHSPKNNEDKADQGLRLEHGLVVVGFVIGFGFVFAVGLLYAKVQRVRRFKLLDNANGNYILYKLAISIFEHLYETLCWGKRTYCFVINCPYFN